MTRSIEDAIRRRLYIGDDDEATLPRITGNVSLGEWRPGQYCLRFETAQDVTGLIYALTYKIFRHLRGDIFGLTAHTRGRQGFTAVYHTLPEDLSLAQAQEIVGRHF